MPRWYYTEIKTETDNDNNDFLIKKIFLIYIFFKSWVAINRMGCARHRHVTNSPVANCSLFGVRRERYGLSRLT